MGQGDPGGNMAVETELKLRIAPEHMERLKAHPLLRQLSSGQPDTRTLCNIYFDTPDLSLHRHEMALRLRQAGHRWLQTLKGGGGVEAGLHSRNEWETEVAGEALDLPALAAAGGQLPRGTGKKLRPVFSTDFTRTVRELHYRSAVIELCMDSGEIRAGRRTRPISELELELKSGDAGELFNLALELLDIVPLEVESASKAEYGYRLHGGEKPAATKAKLPSLDEAQNIPDALRAMVGACLLHVQANVPGALHSGDDEYLHQVRVGLRRLRVVLAMARTCKQDAELDLLRVQTNELAEKLGVARDWDVFVTSIVPLIHEAFPEHAGVRKVLRAAKAYRAECHTRMRATLGSPELSRLILRTGAWMQGQYWKPAPAEANALAEFAARILRKRARRVMQHGKHLTHDDPVELHALRIACKKLRYSGEMLGTLFGKASRTRYLSALSSLQDVLGMLNDIATARRLLLETDLPQGGDTLERMLDWAERERAERLLDFKRAWKRFALQQPFWEM